MGQSTDAYVFYGYCWDDEDVEFGTDMDEVVEAILAERGHADPWSTCPDDRAAASAWMIDNKAVIDEHRALKEDIAAGIGVEWDAHCSDGCPIPFLFVEGTKTTAWRGSPRPLTSLDVDPAWKGKLDAFLESQGIEAPAGENQPGWWVASWWG
jgi:hypothetical protein